MRDHRANQRRWREKRYGKTDLTPGWWWCRLRISPKCEVMNRIDYKNAPKPRGCPPCRVLLDKQHTRESGARRNKRRQAQRQWQREKEARRSRPKCSCCGIRAVWKGRNGDGFKMLCRECFHYGEGRRTSMGEYLIARDFVQAEKNIQKIGENLAKTCHVYTREEIAEYLKTNK